MKTASEERNFDFIEMDPFWNNIYDDAKDKRYGTLFFISCLFAVGMPFLLAALFVNLSLPQWIADFVGTVDKFEFVCVGLAASVTLVASVLFLRCWILAGHKVRQDRSKCSNLSRDELLKARSKLKKQTNPVKFRRVERPAKRTGPRAPDIDLRY
ncbi:MAG TPA: hypothetical protein VGV18_10880 [Verrucomicrobiae bacterium]|nr:hypothetical protein [Verrucomicrobiae bacterium]